MSNKVSIGSLIAAAAGLWFIGRRLMQQRNANNLLEQVVLITGGSRGLGFVMAQEFAQQGAKLIICARDERELESARQQLASQGADVLAIPCDVTNIEQIARMVAQATEHYGQIDVLVNNAGIITVGPLMDQTLKDFEDSMNSMFWGSYHTTRAVLPQMLERKNGHIVNITSIGGKISVPHLLPYDCAKFALVGFSEGLHAEMAKEGIKVLTVVPGLMRTGSPIHAVFKGSHHAEYALFSILDSLPFISMNARKAARQIVRATQQGKAEITLTIPAKVAVEVHGLLPGLTSIFLGMIDRLLPSTVPMEGLKDYTGEESKTPLSESFLTALNRRAAQEYNEILKHGT